MILSEHMALTSLCSALLTCISSSKKNKNPRLPSYDPNYLPGCALFIQPQNGDINSTWIFLRIKIVGTYKVLISLVQRVFNLSRPTPF